MGAITIYAVLFASTVVHPQVPFGVAVGGLTYLSLQGLCNAPGIGPCIQVVTTQEMNVLKKLLFLRNYFA
jgi:hypothetical protein